MKIESSSYTRIPEVAPTEFFTCSYTGSYSEVLGLRDGSINRFLDIASLGGSVLLKDSNTRRRQTMPDGVNPDGSLTSKGYLRWGQKLPTISNKENPYFQVESNGDNWDISINGSLIAEDLASKEINARDMVHPFAEKFNYFLRAGLKEAMLKDKFTIKGDPYFTGRALSSGIILSALVSRIATGDLVNIESFLLLNTFIMGVVNIGPFSKIEDERMQLIKQGIQNPATLWPKIFNFHRRTKKFLPEIASLPLEADRALLSYTYLDLLKLAGNPLVSTIQNA